MLEKVIKNNPVTARVVEELEKMMRKAFSSMNELAQKDGIDHRTAAFVLAVKCVARAAAARKAIGHHLPPSLVA